MSEGESLQRAVSFTIEAGYQLNKKAFEFLDELSSTEDPLKIMEQAIQKIKDLSQKTLFIDREFLEEIKNKSCVNREGLKINSKSITTKRTFRPYSKDVEDDIKILKDPTKKICTTGSINEYLEYFQDRFDRLEKILKKRMDVRNAISISVALNAFPCGAGSMNIFLTQWCPLPPGFVVALIKIGKSGAVDRRRDRM